MKTKEQILEAVKNKNGHDRGGADFLDGRDYSRLCKFFSVEDWGPFGFQLKEGAEPPEPLELTRENVIQHLASDLSFAFDKALGQRGISASLMRSVIKMWMWVLDDELADDDDDDYAQYGLPLLKKVAVKYGLPNEIGDDYGDEYRYACE